MKSLQLMANSLKLVLTFTELEASTCFLMTEFLTFNTTWIAFQLTGCFQGRTELSVHFKQSAGDTEFCSFSLAFQTTALCIDHDIQLTDHISSFQRRFNLVL